MQRDRLLTFRRNLPTALLRFVRFGKEEVWPPHERRPPSPTLQAEVPLYVHIRPPVCQPIPWAHAVLWCYFGGGRHGRGQVQGVYLIVALETR